MTDNALAKLNGAVMDESKRPYHPAADILPFIRGEEFENLKADIAANGLIEPVRLYPDGSIIDGRNRHRACLAVGVRPHFIEWDGGDGSYSDAVRYVISLNVSRRHLSSGQYATAAVKDKRLVEELDRKFRERQLATLKQGNNTPVRQRFDERANGRADDELAALFQTNRQYIHDARRLQDEAPDLFDDVHNGIISLPAAIHQLKIESHQLINQSNSNEWYTPPDYIEAARQVMGGIDLDPASCEYANQTVKAADYYTQAQDGLNIFWYGRIWLNPPYGKEESQTEGNQAVWSRRLIEEYERGHVEQAVLLVNAVPGNRWFAPLWQFPICFPDHRIRFYNEDTIAGQPTHSNALVYLGENITGFIEAFSQFGPVAGELKRYGRAYV